jgi:hypothetical protein
MTIIDYPLDYPIKSDNDFFAWLFLRICSYYNTFREGNSIPFIWISGPRSKWDWRGPGSRLWYGLRSERNRWQVFRI